MKPTFRLAIFCGLFAAGCSDPGPARFHVSGTASVDGALIPFGEVLFTPDGGKQNSGPQGIAAIRDGNFDTAADGMGIAGGPTVVRITGFAKEGGKLLCEHELQVDLPRANSIQTFDVPAKKGAQPATRPEI